MRQFDKAILTLPNDIGYLSLINAFVKQAALMVGFCQEDALKLQLAVEEGVTTIVAPSFIKGEQAEFQVIAEKVPLGMRFILKDQGMPYDPSCFPDYDPASLLAEEPSTALSLFMMKQAADKLEFVNLGKGGKETHIIKYLPAQSVEQCLAGREQSEQLDELPPVALPQYHIRYFLPHEAVEISRLAYFAYGYTYKSYIYYPEQIRELNALGRLVSLVAASSKGDVLGHAALNFAEGDQLTAELGTAFVKNGYRGQGLLKELMQAMINEAEKRKLTGIFGLPVTSHFYSQKACAGLNLQPTALFLAFAFVVKFKDIKPDNQQRESFFYCFRYLHPGQADVPLYLPVHHREIIEKIYSSLKVTKKFISGYHAPVTEAKSIITIQRDMGFGTANIQVLQYGQDVLDEVKYLVKTLKQEDMKVFILELKLSDPQTSQHVQKFEQMGFIFAGIIPNGTGEDRLCLQYLNCGYVDFEQIKVYGEPGQELAGYIRQYYELE